MVTHAVILADSGITFLTSWFDVPVGLSQLDEGSLMDTLWNDICRLSKADMLDPMPELAFGGNDIRQGRTVTDQGVRLALVVRLLRGRAVVMTAGYPHAQMSTRDEEKILRFLGSFEPLH